MFLVFDIEVFLFLWKKVSYWSVITNTAGRNANFHGILVYVNLQDSVLLNCLNVSCILFFFRYGCIKFITDYEKGCPIDNFFEYTMVRHWRGSFHITWIISLFKSVCNLALTSDIWLQLEHNKKGQLFSIFEIARFGPIGLSHVMP